MTSALGVVPQISCEEVEWVVLTQLTFPDVGNREGIRAERRQKGLHWGSAVSSVTKALHWDSARWQFGTGCAALRLVPLGFRKRGTLLSSPGRREVFSAQKAVL